MTLTHKGRPVADWIAEFSTEDELSARARVHRGRARKKRAS